MKFFLQIFCLALVSSCGGGSSELLTPQNPTQTILIPQNDIEILFIGNSHSANHDLPQLVATLLKSGMEDTTVYADLAPGYSFLVDRLGDNVTHEKIKSRNWSFVILQAQKYSSSGLYSYPTTAAEQWIRRSTAQNAVSIMFPEWPRRGNYEEGLRVHGIHLRIASREPACVAPVGLAWDHMIAIDPTIPLHAADGNHSNLNGALLTAYVFYQVISEQSAKALSYIPEIAVSETNQRIFREVAADIVAANPPCENIF